MKTRLCIVGNGMAGIRTLEELLKLAPERYEITVFGAEPHCNYNRILLSPVLAGEKQLSDIILNDDDWYARHNITLHKGKSITAVDPHRHHLQCDEGKLYAYDTLILATGSEPFMIPIPGNDLPGVLAFRDIHDVQRMLVAAQKGRYAVVVGGGLLGLEAAYGLTKQGMQVTLIHLLDSLMERQLDQPAAALLKNSLETRGIRVLLQKQTARILGDQHVSAVEFTDGEQIHADLVVMAVGIRPNQRLAKQAGVYCARGILVDDWLTTSHPDIYAVGECIEHRGLTYGLVAPLYEQAKVLAKHLAGQRDVSYQGSVTSTSLKVTGIDVFSAGDYLGNERSEILVMTDSGRATYRKLVLENNRLVGVVLFGDVTGKTWYLDLICAQSDVSEFRNQLMFGPDFVSASVPEVIAQAA